MSVNFKQQDIDAKGIRIAILDNGLEVGRAYIYLIQNDLHDRPFGLMEDVIDKLLRIKLRNMRFLLRRAEKQDWNFIWSLRVATMKDTIANSYGWEENTQRSYAEESLNGQIVLMRGTRVGVITLSDWGDQLHLTWIAILPDFQRQGIGTELIRYCQQQAMERKKMLTLQVLRSNPAISFYKKCGFNICDQDDSDKVMMQWRTKMI